MGGLSSIKISDWAEVAEFRPDLGNVDEVAATFQASRQLGGANKELSDRGASIQRLRSLACQSSSITLIPWCQHLRANKWKTERGGAPRSDFCLYPLRPVSPADMRALSSNPPPPCTHTQSSIWAFLRLCKLIWHIVFKMHCSGAVPPQLWVETCPRVWITSNCWSRTQQLSSLQPEIFTAAWIYWSIAFAAGNHPERDTPPLWLWSTSWLLIAVIFYICMIFCGSICLFYQFKWICRKLGGGAWTLRVCAGREHQKFQWAAGLEDWAQASDQTAKYCSKVRLRWHHPWQCTLKQPLPMKCHVNVTFGH